MIQLINWRTGLAIVAIAIVSGTIFYSQFLAKKIAREERLKVEQWVEAGKLLMYDQSGLSDKLAGIIIAENKTIPIIVTDEKGQILDYVNLDSASVAKDSNYVAKKLKEFKSENPSVEWTNPSDSTVRNIYYYGHTSLLNQVRYYPIVQLLIVGLFIIITITALTSRYKSVQNQVWAGMAKETAHQLGTPLSSLHGWVEMLKDNPDNAMMVQEMSKDVERLRLVSDRFGKIGSTPQLEPHDILAQVNSMVEYIRKRAPGAVIFSVDAHGAKEMIARISPPLFDWVIENLLKNALDAMEGKGNIRVDLQENGSNIVIDVSDTGKGIPKQYMQEVFKPGFTTKKRGWGLGLSLTKRIIEQYHAGQIFVRSSEQGKGTTFRILLRK
ncbi:MAG: HAMP domain-containing histidine kinase [Chitinophagaceae bacterium]|nr:MAG: HAMP domain-containing histidine kinase [Chitinophagaceae bacterium]